MKGRMMEKIQEEIQRKLDEYKTVQKDFHKAVSQRSQLEGQLNENTAVKTELDLLKKDAEVYKMIGPVLVKQDLEEAKQNVAKRMDYIRGELKRADDTLASLEKQQESHRAALTKLQQQFQQAQMKMAKKP
ncbi:prefoldin subunit 6 [Schistocerca americana]|uniref:prefoldin subunit 6 n=1 Tax=Schistocerca americana TaxID=7009 RepID=UPI001F5030D3|nr:prefoldin subunit 6 [Schistocerca americana]XP_047098876.1 prefoldin subunit 6 [Schistocerca piceifrons]XP_049785512.1 prefoldin subunit 6 [Schistocerca cancellata]XP_049809421.1 prefoldin subunit 6 [Schistocerca nitens]XP_049963741.1 prefoldin subunit 6 [Schistocerca serialis cubense]